MRHACDSLLLISFGIPAANTLVTVTTNTWCDLPREQQEEEEEEVWWQPGNLRKVIHLGWGWGGIRCSETHTRLLVPLGSVGDEHTAPPEAHSPVEAEQGVAVGLLVELPVQELLVEGAQLGRVGLAAHGGAAVLVPVLRPDGHAHVHGGQDAQHAGDHQSRGVAVVDHCSLRRGGGEEGRPRVKED